MDYKKIYDQLIERAINRCTLDGYFEIHHIVPRSLGGDNSPANLVKLTAREHFLAHRILFLIASTSEEKMKMGQAFAMMRRSNSKHRDLVLSSRQYQAAKEAASISQSIKMKELGKEGVAAMVKSRLEKQVSKKVHHWYHPEFGEEHCTTFELSTKYGISSSNLSKIESGSRKICKGWVLYENKDQYEKLANFHKRYSGGLTPGTTCKVTDGKQTVTIEIDLLEAYLRDNPEWKKGGGPRKGHSEETKLKMKNSHLGKKYSKNAN